MHKQLQLLCILILMTLSHAQCGSGAGKLTEFKWILGKWQMKSGENYFVEEWKQINDSTFEGTSYKYPASDPSKKTPLEGVQLISKGGEVFYVPTVVGQNKGLPVYFKFTGKEKEEYVFENKEHDFPQRIIYIPLSKKQMNARVEGTVNERFNVLTLEYQRL